MAQPFGADPQERPDIQSLQMKLVSYAAASGTIFAKEATAAFGGCHQRLDRADEKGGRRVGQAAGTHGPDNQARDLAELRGQRRESACGVIE